MLDRLRGKQVHFIGVGGIGMSALAHLLLDAGIAVSGSDLKASRLTDQLATRGMAFSEGQAATNITAAPPDLVVITAALRPDNPELLAAEAAGIPTIKRAALLGEVMSEGKGIAVAGTHGKTTTSAMIAYSLTRCAADPTYLVGGIVQGLGTNGHLGRGEYVVAEADEYDGSFLQLRPTVSVITNIEADHLDFYGSMDNIRQTFSRYASNTQPGGTLLLCADDAEAGALLAILRASEQPYAIASYGLGAGLDWQVVEQGSNNRGGSNFALWRGAEKLGEFVLSLPGRHNLLNATAAVAACAIAGVDAAQAATALADFSGAERRFQVKGETNSGAVVVDDYGHHPTEIAATLQAARQRYPDRRIIILFQPHTYSRTKSLLPEFAAAFGEATLVYISDIYAAREAHDPSVHARQIVTTSDHPAMQYIGSLAEATVELRRILQPGDVLLTVGAGDVGQVGEELLQASLCRYAN